MSWVLPVAVLKANSLLSSAEHTTWAHQVLCLLLDSHVSHVPHMLTNAVKRHCTFSSGFLAPPAHEGSQAEAPLPDPPEPLLPPPPKSPPNELAAPCLDGLPGASPEQHLIYSLHAGQMREL